jgi:hypothetical protein
MHDQEFELAQFNIARLTAPLDSVELLEFVSFLAPVNAFAEQCRGFVWRLTSPDGGPSSFISTAFPDPMIVPNLSVWLDIESLQSFIYDTVHRYFLQNRRRWFERMDERTIVLWWVPKGHRPTIEEANDRLRHLAEHGATAHAFTFHEAFDSRGRATVSSRTRPSVDSRSNAAAR